MRRRVFGLLLLRFAYERDRKALGATARTEDLTHPVEPRGRRRVPSRERRTSDWIAADIVNKAQISYKANRMIGGHAPSKYLHSLQSHPNVALLDEQMNELLRTHRIEPITMRTNAFDGFFRVPENLRFSH